jgi:hypothetical protein
MRIVQLAGTAGRSIALVEEAKLRLLEGEHADSVYALATEALKNGERLTTVVQNAVGGNTLEYEAVYQGDTSWRFLPSFDHPRDAARCMISGTGLTHKASAENRAAMHKRNAAEITDSIRMYQMGLEAGNPPPGQIGLQPEWFYKGDGSILRGHRDELTIPAYGWDGGEEPEIAGAYLVSPDGVPVRVGLTVSNEFSDHKMEKKNYLYLAPSKLRECAIGPELVIGETDFGDLPGTVTIERDGQTLWQKQIWSGQKNMSYSVANLEHHHFKYRAHRRPGDIHIHFFGADAFSFGEGVELGSGDVMQISFPQFGRALRNRLAIEKRPEALVSVGVL